MLIYYGLCFGLSILLMMIYFYRWRRHFDMLISLLFIIIPVVNMAYFMLGLSKNIEEAYFINKIIYMGGCYLMLAIFICVCDVCDVKVNKWIRVLLLVITTIVYSSVLTIGYSDIFYKKGELITYAGISAIGNKEYGFMHTVFNIMVSGYFFLTFGAIIYSYFKRKQVSRKNIYLLFLTQILGFFSFFIFKLLFKHFEIMPLVYDLDLIIYLIIIDRIGMYNITDTAIDSIVETGEIGFASFDFKLHYLGSNETAKKIIKELNDLTVDKKSENEFINNTLITWINEYIKDKNNYEFHYRVDDKIYLFSINYLYDGFKNRGYQVLIKDDTTDQEYIELLNNYNKDLEKDVLEKTKSIQTMYDNTILGIATLIESRDNSTGGHIKRTSEGVRLLVNEMKKDNTINYPESFYENIIKAAPMHDLGKIAVDDRILRKPGKFSEEEYNEMKKHPTEGARIIAEILDESFNKDFKQIAINVAHYHHEKVDGTGYPLGLKGDEIPIEARIMAIADVYDALVSKRVYKEKLSFEEANKIIMDGFGNHFDKKLEKYYVSARPKLEKYYSSIDC